MYVFIGQLPFYSRSVSYIYIHLNVNNATICARESMSESSVCTLTECVFFGLSSWATARCFQICVYRMHIETK